VWCSSILLPGSPTGPTASTVSGRLVVIVNMSLASRRRRPRCGGCSTAPICPVSGLPARTLGLRRGLPVQRLLQVSYTSMSDHHYRPFREQRAGGADLEETFGHHPCWRFWIAPTSPLAKPWPGCCARGTRAATPLPNTSGCWGGRWNRCRRPTDPTKILLDSRFWGAAILLVLPTPSPPASGCVADRLRGPGSGRSSVRRRRGLLGSRRVVESPACRLAGHNRCAVARSAGGGCGFAPTGVYGKERSFARRGEAQRQRRSD
jgi:hypothetical protein